MVKDMSMQTVHRNDTRTSRDLRTGWSTWGIALALAAVAVACEPAVQPASASASASPEPAASVEAQQAGSQSTTAEDKGSGNPLGKLVPPAPGQEQLVGVVAEHLPAGGYTYLRVEPEHGEPRWVVTMRRDVGAGDRVRVDSLGSRHDFHSRRLDRRFAELVFGVVEIVG
jgi:hypothetical protein